ncbi:restriction endonuclease subunit S [Vibrio sp. 10N.261.51.F12]|uniref:restriction endonuclease subunit S n=1 Tax=Vibrio sp. 10N.261.51.F12 TaxID=3229679 RepID=UPI00354AF179
MSDFEKELELMSSQTDGEPEVSLPSIEEQREIAEKLKQLEAEGKLTSEILEQYFGKFNDKNSAPLH